MICSYCNVEMYYVGINDGGGDYGSSVCDEWQCPACDYIVETDCIEVEYEPEDSYGDGQDFENFYPTEDDPNLLT